MARMIKCVIDSVRVSLTNQQRVVVLREVETERYLPIWIGLYEAEAITIALQKIEVARPQTHDLLRLLMQTLDGRLLHVEIMSLHEDVFYANLVIDQDGQKKTIDCRPSDALALAARTDVPIFVDEDVLTSAGIMPEKDVSDEASEESERKPESGEEDLAVFEDFLDNLGMDSSEGNGSDESDDDEPITGISL